MIQPLYLTSSLKGRFFAGYGVGLISAMSKLASLLDSLLADLIQFLFTNLRLPLSGSEAPLLVLTS